MSEPIVFVSHFRVKEGKLDGLEQYFREGTRLLHEEKPRTLVFLAYLDEDGTGLTIVHVFADAESMDLHVQGAEERTKAASEFLEPQGSEIYGSPSEPVLEMLRQAATSEAHVSFQTRYLGGFLRLRPA
jgi:quinol monooxygenase YgiN